MDTFPENIFLEKEGFSFSVGKSKLEASFEGGETLQKRLFRKVPDRFVGQFVLTSSQLETFINFYKTTLNEGTKTFLWKHPLNDAQVTAKFVADAPSYSSLQGDYWQVQASFEIINEL